MLFPRLYFDKVKTVRLIECLKRYRRAINSKTDTEMAPQHDSASHGADALRYLGVVADLLTNEDYVSSIPDPVFQPHDATMGY